MAVMAAAQSMRNRDDTRSEGAGSPGAAGQRTAGVPRGEDQHLVDVRAPQLPVVAAVIQGVADRRALGGERPRHRDRLRAEIVVAPREQERAQRIDGEPRGEGADVAQRAVVGQHRRARVGEDAGAGLQEIARPGLDVAEQVEVVQGDVDRSVAAGGEAGDDPMSPPRQGEEAMVDIVDDVDDGVLVGAGGRVGPFGVREQAAVDLAVGEHEDHRTASDAPGSDCPSGSRG